MSAPNFYPQKHFDMYCADESYVDEYGETQYDEWLYEDTQHFIDNKLNPQLKYLKIEVISGYFYGLQTNVKQDDNPNYFYTMIDFLYYLNNKEEYTDKEIYEIFGFNKYILDRVLNKEIKLINEKLLPQLKDFGFECYDCVGIFSNGEAVYQKRGD